MEEKDSLLIPSYKEKFSGILLFGPPGSGKGMLGKFLSSAGSQYHLSTGDIFRALPSSSPAGKLFYSYASRGLLVPDDPTIEIWRRYVQGLMAINAFNPESQDILLDGMPRTLKQAEILQNFVHVRHVIVLEVSNKEELLFRMQKKMRLEGRVEEIEMKVLEKRLEVYEKGIGALLDFYPHHLISKINGGQRPLEVLRDVLVRLSHLLSREVP